jgi:hypothetical protein
MNEEDFIYNDEELDEIDYFEIVSLDEIIKLNPTFVAFSNEEIYNYIYNFFKSKTKTEGFLNLFNNIIEKQKNKINTNNFIVVADAFRDNFSDLDIDDFVNKIKKTNKEQIDFAFKNKNKIWFPLIYDNDSNKIKFKASNTTIIDLNIYDNNDKYIIFKDDERDIPIMGVYFYEPKISNYSYLNEKIASHLIVDRQKDKMISSDNFKSFDELIKSYKIDLPLNKIDSDEYHYYNLNSLFNKFNKDLDNLDIKDFDLLKNYLIELNKKEKIETINYSKNISIKPLNIKNNRFYFFDFLKKSNNLIDITHKSLNKIKQQLELLKNEKNIIEPLPFINDLNLLILNLNNNNYDEIIKNLQDIRKNLSLDNSINSLEKYIKININDINNLFKNIQDKFNILLTTYKDIYKISFTFEEEEHEIKIGNDIKNYEGAPIRVDEFKKNMVYVDENEEDEYEEEEIDDKNIYDEFKKYYYNTEKGFNEALKILLPFISKLKNISKIPINFDIIITHLFNIHRGIPEKYMIIKNKYGDDFNDNYYKELALKPIKYVLTSDIEDDKLKNANIEYMNIIISMIYDVICKWSIETQNDILNESLLFIKDRCYIPCIHLWNDYGCPYDMNSKDGILYYILCIFEDVFKEEFSENDYNYLKLDKEYKKIILKKLNEEYNDDLKKFNKIEIKKKKENKGLEAGKKLIQLYKEKQFKNDNFLNSFIEALIYMPSYKYEKIHKYLLGCCLEKIDENFSADTYLKLNREDLKKAKNKLAEERVLNKSRYKRFYLEKTIIPEKKEVFKSISNFINYKNFYNIPLEDWFTNYSDNTIINSSILNEIKSKLRNVYNIHINHYIQSFFNKKTDLIKNFNFYNYKQILINISKILLFHLKNDAFKFISKINNTIYELDKLSSIINDDNITDIIQIRSIIVIRCMCLPSYPDISNNSKLIPSIQISMDLNKQIINDISKKIFNIIENSKMPTLIDQINYINKIREENKDKILASLNKKTREEKDILKEMKKIGLDIQDDDAEISFNKDKTDNFEVEGENEFNVGKEDDYDDDNLDNDDYGFIYAD